MAPSVQEQPGKAPEAAPVQPKSPAEQARDNQYAQQAMELAEAEMKRRQGRAEVAQVAAAQRADLAAAPTAAAGAPAAAPAAPGQTLEPKARSFFKDNIMGKLFMDIMKDNLKLVNEMRKEKGVLGFLLNLLLPKFDLPDDKPAETPAPSASKPVESASTAPTVHPAAVLQVKQEIRKKFAPVPEPPPTNADETWGLQGSALLNHPKFQARAKEICDKLGVKLEELYTIFLIESGGDPYRPNALGSGAIGLIQWMPSTAKGYGISTEDLRHMSGLQQLDYVEKYFQRYAGKLHSFADIYRAVFFPAAIGKGPDYIFGAPDMAFARKVGEQNPGIRDVCGRPDGLIDNAGFENYCALSYSKKRGWFSS